MKLCDVNVLVYAHRPDASPEHAEYAEWLRTMAASPENFGLSDAVLTGFIRIVTNRRIFKDPTPVETALAFCEALRNRPNARILRPGPNAWRIYSALCRDTPARGTLSADAWHAALALEWNCTWYSADADFSRFKGLKWKHPLQ